MTILFPSYSFWNLKKEKMKMNLAYGSLLLIFCTCTSLSQSIPVSSVERRGNLRHDGVYIYSWPDGERFNYIRLFPDNSGLWKDSESFDNPSELQFLQDSPDVISGSYTWDGQWINGRFEESGNPCWKIKGYLSQNGLNMDIKTCVAGVPQTLDLNYRPFLFVSF